MLWFKKIYLLVFLFLLGNNVFSYTITLVFEKNNSNMEGFSELTENVREPVSALSLISNANQETQVKSYLINSKDAVSYSIIAVLISVSLIIFFSYKKGANNIHSIFLSSSLIFLSLLILLSTKFGKSFITSDLFFLKANIFLIIFIIPIFVLFFNNFCKIGFNKLDIIFFCLLFIALLLNIFINKIEAINFINYLILISTLIPAIFYSTILMKKIIQGSISHLLIFSGIIAGFIFLLLFYFIKVDNNILNLLFFILPSVFFIISYLNFYFNLHHELVENKYMLEGRLLESNIIVDDKNESNVSLDETVHIYKNLLNNAVFLSKCVNERFKSELIEIDGLTYDIFRLSSKELSGDFVKLLKIEDGFRFIIIDYPGDEISASIINLVLEYEMKNYFKLKSPLKVLKKMNECFLIYGFNTVFSAFILDISPKKSAIKISSAGFPEIFHITNNNLEIIDVPGMPVGLKADDFIEKVINIKKGDEILIFTDGIMHQIRKSQNETFQSFIERQDNNKIYTLLTSIANEEKDNLLDDITILRLLF